LKDDIHNDEESQVPIEKSSPLEGACGSNSWEHAQELPKMTHSQPTGGKLLPVDGF